MKIRKSGDLPVDRGEVEIFYTYFPPATSNWSQSGIINKHLQINFMFIEGLFYYAIATPFTDRPQ